ncbi:MAG: hypothetical protein ABI333_01840 [bacterium]
MRWCPLVMVLVLQCASATATAAPSASEGDKAKARSLVRTAKKLLKKRNLRQAIRFFEQAHRYWPRHEIQFNIAVVYLELKDKVKAATHLRSYLKYATSAERARLPLPLAKLLTETGVLRLQAPARDIAIWVDDRLEGMGKIEVVVLPGKRVVELRKGDRVLTRKTLDVTGGQTLVWTPETDVVERRRVAGGDGSTTPADGGRKKLHWVYFVATAGLAVVAGLTTIGTGVKTLQLHDDFKADPTNTNIQDEGNRFKTATNVLLGITAAAGITAAVLAFFTRWKKKEKSSAVKVQPGVTPGGASVSLQLEF